MTISNDDELRALGEIGRIVARTLAAMGKALEPGMTTAELDAIGRDFLERHGARPAPELAYDFPAANCISVNKEIVHASADEPRILPGIFVNLAGSTEKDGFFSDT